MLNRTNKKYKSVIKLLLILSLCHCGDGEWVYRSLPSDGSDWAYKNPSSATKCTTLTPRFSSSQPQEYGLPNKAGVDGRGPCRGKMINSKGKVTGRFYKNKTANGTSWHFEYRR